MKPIGNIFGFDCVTCEHNRDCYGGNMGNQFRYCQKSAEKNELLKDNEELKKQLEERKYYKFYKYENNPNGSNYCFCERPCDSNMSLKCFFENGEICGFMSETLVSDHDNIEEISLNEFAHDFIKPLINANFQNKNQQKEFISYLEDKIYSIEPKGTGIIYNCEYDSEEDYVMAMQEQSRLNALKEILQKYRSIIGGDK